MSGQGGLDYAYVLWVWVCSLYTTLLTVTAICVAVLLRKRRSSYLKCCSLPQASFQAIDSAPADAQARRVFITKDTAVVDETTPPWNIFYKEHTNHNFSCNESPVNSQSSSHLEKHSSKYQIQIIKPIDSWSENNNIASNESSLKNVESNQSDSKCFDSDVKHYPSEIKCNERSSELCIDLVKSDAGDDSSDDDGIFVEIEDNQDQIDSQNIGYGNCNDDKSNIECAYENNSVKDIRFKLNINVPDTSLIKETDIDQLGKSDSIDVDILVYGVVNESIAQSGKEHISDCHTLIPTEQPVVASQEKNTVLEEVDDLNNVEIPDTISSQLYTNNTSVQSTLAKLETNLYTFRMVSNNQSGDIYAPHIFPTKMSLEMLDKEEIILNNKAKDSKAHNTPLVDGQVDSGSEIKDEKRKTVVYEDEDGNISITQSLHMETIAEDGNAIPLKQTTFIYETDTGTISVTQILPATCPPMPEKETLKSSTPQDKDENGAATEMVTSNTVLSGDETKNENLEDNVRLLSIPFSELDHDKKETKYKEPVDPVLNEEEENPSADAKDSSMSSEKTENIGLYDNVQYSSNQLGHVISKHKVTINSEKSNNAMTKILLAGLIPIQRINNDESDIIPDTLMKPHEQALHEKKANKCQSGACSVAKSNSVILTDSTDIVTLENSEPVDKCQTNIIDHNGTAATVPESSTVPDVNKLSKKAKSKKSIQSSTKHNLPKNKNPIKLDSNKTDVSIALKEFDGTENEPTDQIITLENLIKDTQRNLNQLISHLRKENQVNSETSVKTCALEPILEDHKSLQKDLSAKSSFKKSKSEDGTHFRDLIVYQTATETSVRPEKLEQEIAFSSINRFKFEKGSSTSENIINADYVTVSHRLPIPSSKTDSFFDIDKNNFTVLSDAKIEIVDVGCSHSNSPSRESSPNRGRDRLEYKTAENSDSEDSASAHSDIEFRLVETESAVSEIQKTIEKSILNDLLYMGERSESGIVDKSSTAVGRNINERNENCKTKVSVEPYDTLFYITKDSSQGEEPDIDENVSSDVPICGAKEVCVKPSNNTQSFHQMKYENSKKELENELLESYHDSARSARNRHFERIVSSSAKDETDHLQKRRKDTDNTKELLDMLAKYTNKDKVNNPNKDSTGLQGLDYADLTPERLVSSSRLKSVAFNQNDPGNLLTTLVHSKQNSSIGTDFDNDFGSDDSSPERIPPRMTSQGTKAMKTLRFEDVIEVEDVDIYDEYSSSRDTPVVFTNPLKKNAFGETFYYNNMNEEYYRKSHVIPTYLKDVSDGLKALMTDLVKPMADVIPFGTGSSYDRELREKSSINSTEVQANLFTSSQVDLQPTSPYVIIPGKALKSIIKPYCGMCAGSSESSGISYNTASMSNRSCDSDIRQNGIECLGPGILQFDPSNPLNNVLLPPIDFNAHQYSPIKSEPKDSETSIETYHNNDDNIITQYSILHVTPNYLTSSDITYFKSETDTFSIDKLVPIDESIETHNYMNKDVEMNTVITMQDNQRLLADSSSLTLVNSMLDRATHVQCSPSSKFDKNSPALTDSLVEVIYKQQLSQMSDDAKKVKNKKKCDRKSKKSTPSAIDDMSNKMLKPTPTISTVVSKTSKLASSVSTMCKTASNTSKSVLNSVSFRINGDRPKHHSTPETESKIIDKGKRSTSLRTPHRDKTKTRGQSKNHNSSIVVQQVAAEYDHYDREDTKVIHDGKVSDEDGNFANVLESTSWHSCNRSSSKDMGDSISSDMGKDKGFPMDWQPELLNELSSKNLVTECESSVDVVENIDLLPFMGTRECAWEVSSPNEWVFRLLHGRLRMIVCLAHSECKCTIAYPARSDECVRADTPVRSITLEATKLTMKNAVADLCIRFAMDAMRYFIGRGCARAGDVPALLRRCAAVARIALRWGRAMYDCWMHLVYNIDGDGYLSLNVANIPLRSVWDVTMKIELVADEHNEVPWPRAADVRVSPVVACVDVTPEDVATAIGGVSSDWGHAPRTLWRVVRYLQNLRKGEEKSKKKKEREVAESDSNV